MRQTVKMGKVRPVGAFAALHAGKMVQECINPPP